MGARFFIESQKRVNNAIVKLRFALKTSTPVVTVHPFCARNYAASNIKRKHNKEGIYGVIGFDTVCSNLAFCKLFWILGDTLFSFSRPIPFPILSILTNNRKKSISKKCKKINVELFLLSKLAGKVYIYSLSKSMNNLKERHQFPSLCFLRIIDDFHISAMYCSVKISHSLQIGKQTLFFKFLIAQLILCSVMHVITRGEILKRNAV